MQTINRELFYIYLYRFFNVLMLHALRECIDQDVLNRPYGRSFSMPC